jgi:hypothetical protein
MQLRSLVPLSIRLSPYKNKHRRAASPSVNWRKTTTTTTTTTLLSSSHLCERAVLQFYKKATLNAQRELTLAVSR